MIEDDDAGWGCCSVEVDPSDDEDDVVSDVVVVPSLSIKLWIQSKCEDTRAKIAGVSKVHKSTVKPTTPMRTFWFGETSAVNGAPKN